MGKNKGQNNVSDMRGMPSDPPAMTDTQPQGKSGSKKGGKNKSSGGAKG